MMDLGTMTRWWWAVALRGLAAIIFGIIAIVWPGLTLFWLVIVFGAYAIVDGVIEIYSSIVNRARNGDRWWVGIIEGVVSVAAGLIAWIWPGLTALALLYLIAAWAVITGVMEIVLAIEYRRVIQGEWLMVLGGILSIIFGLILFAYPRTGALSMIWVIGIYAIIFGIALIMLGFRLKGMHDRVNYRDRQDQSLAS